MATVYSAEYVLAYNTVPHTKRAPSLSGYKQCQYWSYTQSGAGNDPDTIYLIKIPAGSRLLLPECAIWTVGAPGGTVFDLGHGAYTEPDGDAVVASTTALGASIDVGATGLWFGGMVTGGGTPDDLIPAVLTWWFNSREDVIITLVAKTSALQDADVVQGYLTYVNS